MVRTCGEKDGGRLTNENMKDGSEWRLKDMKTETEVESYYKRPEADSRTEIRRSTR